MKTGSDAKDPLTLKNELSIYKKGVGGSNSLTPITFSMRATSQEIVELLKDYETQGCSKREIAEHYGISTSSVYRLYYENMLALSV